MFSITKLTQRDRDFLVGISNLGKSRSPEASVALARVLTHCMSIPSAPVDSPVLFYKTQNGVAISNMISDLNELLVIDVKCVQDYCEKFFLYRYYACHPANNVLAINPETAIEDFFGVSKAMPREVLDIVRAHSAKICTYVSGFKGIMDSMKESTPEELGLMASM